MKYYASTSNEITQREIDNEKRAKEIAKEAVVLLENDGTLPLGAPCKIALFGNGVRWTIKGGTGSGGVNSRKVVNIEQGLDKFGFRIVSNDWLLKYDEKRKKHIDDYRNWTVKRAEECGVNPASVAMNEGMKECEIIPVTDEDIKEADACIYVLSRNSGEGCDRFEGEGDYKLFPEELKAINKLAKAYDKFILILNIGGVLDMSDIKTIEGINSVVLLGQLGNLTGEVLPEVILGMVNPSGRLADTWAKDFMDYPSSATFSHVNGNVNEEIYSDGIYVGYKYFDTFKIPVIYPFGYGLSYTSFETEVVNVTGMDEVYKKYCHVQPLSDKDKLIYDFIFGKAGARAVSPEGLSRKVLLECSVKNTGSMPGKEVVQVYGSAPRGRMDKAEKVLVGYAKTGVINPGESEDVLIVVDIKDMSSFCENCSAWVLHKGDYRIYVGKNISEVRYVADLVLDNLVKWGLCKTIWEKNSNLAELTSNYKLDDNEEYDGRNAESDYVINIKSEDIEVVTFEYTTDRKKSSDSQNSNDKLVSFEMVLSGEATVEDMVKQLSNRELALLAAGKHKEEDDEVTKNEYDDNKGEEIAGNSSISVPGAAADTTDCIYRSRGVRSLVTADGPAGLRLQPVFKTDLDGNYIPGGEIFEDSFNPFPEGLDESNSITYYQYCTAIPIAWSLAMTWNKEALFEAGDIVGGEMEEFGVDLWLAPGMNIHRNPLCGRNFEYYSEDPYVSGTCASMITKGVQSHAGKGTTIKHFAANNQEDNRFFVNNIMSERAIREVYLRGFEICVREARPKALMTSYNMINGYHTSNSFGLVQNILKDEWEYRGLVMSDWCTTMGNFDQFYLYDVVNPKSAPSGCVYAGNDIIMPGCIEDVRDILKAVESGDEVEGFSISRDDLERCAESVIRCVVDIEKAKRNI